MKKRKNKDNNKVTIYDVAEEAHVSLATVSRVINGSSVVKASTKERVQAVIDRLDFKPNEIARGLAKSKTTTIAVVFPESIFAHVKDMIGGIGDTCRSLGYNVIFYTTDDIGKKDDVIGNVVRQRVDGVILFNSEELAEHMDTMIKYKMPVVVIGDRHLYLLPDQNVVVEDEETESPRSIADYCGSVFADIGTFIEEKVTEYLERGQNDICFVQSKQNLIKDAWIVEGIKAAYEKKGISLDSFKEVSCSTEYLEEVALFDEYFKTNKHDLVVCNYDKEAVAVLAAAKHNGIKVPEDMEIIGMFNSTYAQMTEPMLTTVNIPVYNMGAIGVRLLTKILNNEPIDSREYGLKCFYMEHETTK